MDGIDRQMGDEKKNQHFVPRSFLRAFAIDSEDSLIWGYDKKHGKCTGKRSIGQICSFDYYYEQLEPDGSRTQNLEDGFQTIETPAIETIRNLSASQELSPHDKACLAFYIGLLLTRGPSFRDGVHELHRHAVEIVAQKEYESGRLPEPPAILKKLIINNDITSVMKTEILPHVSLQHMIDVANSISQSLCNKKWDIYEIKDNQFFVTSDTPVIFGASNPKDNKAIGPANEESLVLCPITKKMLIAARPYCETDCSGSEFIPVKDAMVGTINDLMCFNAQRFVYASGQSQELLDCIKKAKGFCKKFKAHRFGNAIISQWDILINECEQTTQDKRGTD